MKNPVTTLSLFAGLLLSPLTGWSQSSYLQQTFEPGGNTSSPDSPNLVFTNVGGLPYTGTLAQATSANNTNSFPTTAAVASEGITGWGVVNNEGNGIETSILTFAPVAFPVISGNFLSFRLSSCQTNNGGGIDDATTNNGALVSIAYNGSSTFTETLKVLGVNRGSVFTYGATGIATTPAPINTATPTLTTVTSPNDVTGNGQNLALTGNRGYSTVRLAFGSNITQIQIRITLVANDKTAIFIDDVRIGSGGPLPVELTAFDAVRQNNAVLLKWATASEKDNDAFEVQRGTSPTNFETLARVAGQGTTSRGYTYQWQDNQPLAGVSYYRLRQLDFDGSASYSPVAIVGQAGRFAVPTFSPNPTTGFVTLASDLGNARYRVLNTLGQVLLTGQATSGETINMQSLRAGSYFLEIQSASGRQVQRFIREL